MKQRATSDKGNSSPQPAAQPREPTRKPSRDPDASGADRSGVEGEGSYTATRRYNEGLQEHLREHDVEEEAETARQALEGDERAELEQAEERGKRGPAKHGKR